MPVAPPAPGPGGRAELERPRQRCAGVANANANATITAVDEKLMDRVERDMDMRGNSFSLFQTAISLESTAEQGTAALTEAMQDLERRNRDLEASNEATEAASCAKSAFLATMNHELRTPMNGVVGMTELLLNGGLAPAQRRSVDVMRRSAGSLRFDLRRTTGHALSVLQPQVEDTGIGIAPDALPRLFQSFTQTNGSITRKYGGTGTSLGLAFVRRLCELMGGDCGVRGELGRGSTFWFTLALKRGRQDRSAQATGVFQVLRPRRPDAADAPGRHVLRVEDNLINQQVTLGIFELLGARARVADNGLCQLAAAINRGCPQHPLPATDTPREMPA